MKRLNEEGQVVNPILAEFEEDSDKERADQIVLGWNNVEEAAKEILSTVLSRLVSPETIPVFLWKNTDSNSDLQQIVVVDNNTGSGDFGLGIIHAGYTMVLPHIPFSYLETDVITDMKKYKIGKDIITAYEKILNRWRKE